MTAPSTLAPALLATFFHGLADPARLSCLLAVREGPKTVGEIVTTTGLSQPNVSKHLACLWDCGLVRRQRNGRFVIYELASEEVETVLRSAEGLLERVGHLVGACPNYRIQ
jgi:ArsR family transcriptional regulator, cadmium/lead-responsive transcriptional repressor